MPDPTAERRPALAGLRLVSRPGVIEVADAGPCSRFVFRGDPRLIGAAFGATLPTTPLSASVAGARAALWLGPDEWLLLLPASDDPHPFQSALAGAPACLLDVSQRNFGLTLEGPRAADALAAGCPLDLAPAAFPVGMCARTIFAKAEIILWRSAPEIFRLEAWRSFAPYVTGLLTEAIDALP